MSQNADFHPNQPTGILGFLTRIILLLIAGAVLTVVAIIFLPEIQRQREEEHALQQLKAEVEKQELILSRKSRELHLLKTDPSYVETIARDKLDQMKEGETIIRFDSAAQPKHPPRLADPETPRR